MLEIVLVISSGNYALPNGSISLTFCTVITWSVHYVPSDVKLLFLP